MTLFYLYLACSICLKFSSILAATSDNEKTKFVINLAYAQVEKTKFVINLAYVYVEKTKFFINLA